MKSAPACTKSKKFFGNDPPPDRMACGSEISGSQVG
jgi:hypothetical protein